MKLKYGILIISLLSTVLITGNSCTKLGKNVTIEGRVMNPITGEGIAGIELELLRTTSGLPGGYKSVKSTNSNSDGSYEISKGGLAGYWLACRVPAEYYQIGWVQDGSNVTTSTGNLTVKKGKKMHADFYAVSYGEIKTSIHNVNCQGATDIVIFKREYSSFSNISVFQDFIYSGCYNNEGSFAKVPSGNYKLEWTVIRGGQSNVYSHILFVPPNGQGSYNIEY